MRQCYVAVSFQKRDAFRDDINVIEQVLKENNFSPFVFVDRYTFAATESKAMMKQAFMDIQNSNLLIAEVSDKAIGIGIEVGFAVAKNIPVLYLRRSDAEHSTTIEGCAHKIIIYQNGIELATQLKMVLQKFI